jgi:hypothetical protein
MQSSVGISFYFVIVATASINWTSRPVSQFVFSGWFNVTRAMFKTTPARMNHCYQRHVIACDSGLGRRVGGECVFLLCEGLTQC